MTPEFNWATLPERQREMFDRQHRNKSNCKLTAAEELEIADRRREGHSYTDLAKISGLSPTGVLRVVRRVEVRG